MSFIILATGLNGYLHGAESLIATHWSRNSTHTPLQNLKLHNNLSLAPIIYQMTAVSCIIFYWVLFNSEFPSTPRSHRRFFHFGFGIQFCTYIFVISPMLWCSRFITLTYLVTSIKKHFVKNSPSFMFLISSYVQIFPSAPCSKVTRYWS
jgi:hypothetical protein